jgi:uncharacterized oxidoreductase
VAIEEVVQGFGSSPEEAKLVSENLVLANLTGHDSHGIGILPRYVESLRETNGLKANAKLSITVDHGHMIGVDGGGGFGQSLGHQAMQVALERCVQFGSCIMALGNVHHLCRIGAFAEMAAKQNVISIHFVNVLTRPIVAPFDGSDARFGTNPFCVGIPIADQDPVILDFATSVIAQGKVRVAHNRQQDLKPGQMIDDQGQPTTDPVFGVKPPFGAIRTFGEHKGFGLALVCELLGGALSAQQTLNQPTLQRRIFNGMLTILIDPTRFDANNQFVEQARSFVDWVQASPPAPESPGVKIAGQPERELKAQRLQSGIPVDDHTWQEILTAAASLDVDIDKVNRLASAQ